MGQQSVLTSAWAQETPAIFFLRAFPVLMGKCVIYASFVLSSAWAQKMPAFFLRAFSVPTGIRSNAAEGDDDVDDDDPDDPWLQKC